jgi:hypothetical protein
MNARATALLSSIAFAAASLTGGAALAGPSSAGPLPSGRNCITTTVARITTRLTSEDSSGKESQVPGSGYQIVLNGRLPDKYGGYLEPTLVFYQEAAENTLIARERVGDKVQVCVTGFPDADDPAVCNPKTDRRGRELRVYDYARKFAYEGPNSEHMCGGA